MDPLIPTGAPAPDFCLPGLDGEDHCLADARGQVLVLAFWSAECPWSERADETLHDYFETWGQRVLWWSIASNANETPDLVRQTAAARQVPVLLLDRIQAVADLYGAQTTPHYFVIDPDGVLRYQGALNDVTFRQHKATQEFLRQAVEAVLRGEQPEPAEIEPYGCSLVRYAP